jgi:ribosomal protein S18 acetylase RimI-like enzyme
MSTIRFQDSIATVVEANTRQHYSMSQKQLASENELIEYRHNFPLETQDIVRVFESSGIIRPTCDPDRIARIFSASSSVISAWSNQELVGVCRALSDHGYCCYLSDLAVSKPFQRQGIGSRLLAELRKEQGDEVSIILLSAPSAMSYYPALGFSSIENGFILRRSH